MGWSYKINGFARCYTQFFLTVLTRSPAFLDVDSLRLTRFDVRVKMALLCFNSNNASFSQIFTIFCQALFLRNLINTICNLCITHVLNLYLTPGGVAWHTPVRTCLRLKIES